MENVQESTSWCVLTCLRDAHSDGVMSSTVAEFPWWMLPSQSFERSRADRQDANFKSFWNVMTDWQALRDKTSICVEVYLGWRPGEDAFLAIWNAFSKIDWYVYHIAARVSHTGGHRRHYTHAKSSLKSSKTFRRSFKLIQFMTNAPVFSWHSLIPVWFWG